MPSFNQRIPQRSRTDGAWDGQILLKGFALTAFLLAAVMQATNPVLAQNINDLLTIFGGDRHRATRRAAQAEWRRLPPVEMACIDRGLRRKGSSIEKGVSPQRRETLGCTID